MSRPVYSAEARTDLMKISEYIARDNPTAARRFIDQLEQKCADLALSPEMGFPCDELSAGLLCWPVGNYVVFYRSLDHKIEIARILHGARDIPREFK